MYLQQDKLFLDKLNTLTREVLADEARFVYKNDQRFAVLHQKLFSKQIDSSVSALDEMEAPSLRKYFYTEGTTLRTDVPFTDSPEDQIFFFDQIHNLVKYVSYDFDRMDFIRPAIGEKAEELPKFSENQLLLLETALIEPLIHGLEQREISRIEKKSSASTDAKVESVANPYQSLGDKILVKGQTGSFDTILTFAQVKEIAAQESVLRTQGLDELIVQQLLLKFINQRYPGLNPALSPSCRLQIYSGPGLSGKISQTDFSFAQLVTELKTRQGRQMQMSAIIASKGTLGFSTKFFQVKSSNANLQAFGTSLYLDQGGLGDNVSFFLEDNQGGMARVTFNDADHRLNGQTKLNFHLYEQPNLDIPGGKVMSLATPELGRLSTPLKKLYSELQPEQDFDPVTGKARPPISLPAKGAKYNDLGPSLSAEPSFSISADTPSSIDLDMDISGFKTPPKKITLTTTSTFTIPKPLTGLSASPSLPPKSKLSINPGQPSYASPAPVPPTSGSVFSSYSANPKAPFPKLPVEGPSVLETSSGVSPKKKMSPITKTLLFTSAAAGTAVGIPLISSIF